MTLAEGVAKGLVGALEKEHIRSVVRAHHPSVKGCYEDGLRGNPNAKGRVVIQFVISGKSTVEASRVAESSLALPAVDECIAREACSWRFSEPEGEGEVIVTYPFALTPEAETSSAATPPNPTLQLTTSSLTLGSRS